MTEELKTLLSREPVRREVPPPPPEWRCGEVDAAALWRELGVEPMFPELYDLATTCPEVFDCYRKLVALWDDERSRDIIFKAAWTGADIAKVVDLLWHGRYKEAEEAARP